MGKLKLNVSAESFSFILQTILETAPKGKTFEFAEQT